MNEKSIGSHGLLLVLFCKRFAFKSICVDMTSDINNSVLERVRETDHN